MRILCPYTGMLYPYTRIYYPNIKIIWGSCLNSRIYLWWQGAIQGLNSARTEPPGTSRDLPCAVIPCLGRTSPARGAPKSRPHRFLSHIIDLKSTRSARLGVCRLGMIWGWFWGLKSLYLKICWTPDSPACRQVCYYSFISYYTGFYKVWFIFL